MTDYIDEIFGEGGKFSQVFENYEVRPGQIEGAREIDKAFAASEHLMIEGPCGVGKAQMCLVPAMYHAERGEPIIYATANIALQEQLINKDLPLLSKVLGRPLSYALVKGKNNFLCNSSFNAWKNDMFIGGDPVAQDILKWGESTTTGDVSELDFVPDWKIWGNISGDETCETCAMEHCFYYEMKQKAQTADVIVCNYHVLFAQAANPFAKLLPNYRKLILDEAHEAADVARMFAETSISEKGINNLITTQFNEDDPDTAQEMRIACDAFFDQVVSYATGPDYKHRIKDPKFSDVGQLDAALGKYILFQKKLLEETNEKLSAKAMRKNVRAAEKAQNLLSSLANCNAGTHAFWIEDYENAQKSTRVKCQPVDVSEFIGDNIFAKAESVICVSATLTTGGKFDFIADEIGFDGFTLSVESPFDFKRQTLLVTPQMSCQPNDREFPDEIADKARDIVTYSRGRALGLFTSYKNMRIVAEALEDLPYKILVQGQAPRSRLLEEFRDDESSVLFGTKSFWQGVDVQGDSLSCLILDKIPFPHFTDPIIGAIAEKDPKWFFNASLPRAIIALRQGFGRLIRSASDRGVVVIFDPRVRTKAYGKTILKSLPTCKTSRKLRSVQEFFAIEEVPF